MTEAQFKKLLDQQTAALFGQISHHLDTQIEELRDEVKGRFDQLTTTVDGIAKRLDDDDQERVAASAELERHKEWIGQISEGTGTKLAPGQ